MTRVAFVTNMCPYYRRPLFEELDKRLNIDFYFFSNGRERYRSKSIRHEAGAFTTVDLPVWSVGRHAIQPTLMTALTPSKYDVVVKCLNGMAMVPYVYTLARLRGIPFVLWTGMWHHPTTAGQRLTRRLVANIYRGAGAIVTYGDHVSRFVIEESGIDAGRVFAAGQAIETSRFEGVNPSFGEPPVVLYIGQLEPWKGIDVLVKAASALPSQTRLRFVGSGSLADELRRNGFDVLGHLPQDQLPRQLENARCLVLPSITTPLYKEAWGLVVNEAMAAGLPVVATTAVGAAAAGLIQDGVNGRIVPEHDPIALCAALSEYCESAAKARAMGAAARAEVAKFDYNRMATAFVDAIVLAQTGRSHCRL